MFVVYGCLHPYLLANSSTGLFLKFLTHINKLIAIFSYPIEPAVTRMVYLWEVTCHWAEFTEDFCPFVDCIAAALSSVCSHTGKFGINTHHRTWSKFLVFANRE